MIQNIRTLFPRYPGISEKGDISVFAKHQHMCGMKQKAQNITALTQVFNDITMPIGGKTSVRILMRMRTEQMNWM